jgi:hypothetical protein
VFASGREYCLKILGVLGGEYGGDKLGTISFDELIRALGMLLSKSLTCLTGR